MALRHLLLAMLLAPALCFGQGGADPNEALRKLAWQAGPADGKIADKAVVKLPAEYVFLDAPNTARFLELMGNPPPRTDHFTLAPKSLDWFAVFSFDPVGYVKDDEKIDADALLASIRESDEPANKERKRLGMNALYTDGWQVPPHYDAATKRLEWGMRLRTDRNEHIVNYTSRLLGRTGVMSAVLVSDPKSLASDTAEFKNVLRGFDYVGGEKYAEFKPGDRIAEYGLAALIVGGAAAAAAKSGLLKSLGKFLWVIVFGVAAGAWGLVKSLLGRKKGDA